jgi:glycosyltransferase involved in cell wall biosynthesis
MKPQPIAQSGDGLRLVFVGGSNHHPNRDGLLWFLKYVWPELKRRLPTSELTVCGHWENGILPSESENVEFTGQIPEAALLDILSNSTIGISPLRFGAGMKRKTLSYFSSGLPVVSTKYGVEGLASSPEIVPGTILAETPEEWVSAIYDLSSDNQLWKQKSAEGLMFVETRFSPNAFLSSIGSLFSELLERKVSDGRTQSSI